MGKLWELRGEWLEEQRDSRDIRRQLSDELRELETAVKVFERYAPFERTTAMVDAVRRRTGQTRAPTTRRAAATSARCMFPTVWPPE